MAEITEDLLAVADEAALQLQTAWGPAGPDAVHRDYITEDVIATLTGRHLFVKPSGAGRAERISRGEVINAYRVAVLMLEKFTDPGPPDKAWIDDRVKWLGPNVYKVLFKNVEDPANYLLGEFWTETGEITDAVSEEQLMQTNLFWAECEFEFRKIVAE